MPAAIPIVAAVAPMVISAISNAMSSDKTQAAQAQRQGITKEQENQYRATIGGIPGAINNQTRTASMGAQQALGNMYGQNPYTPTPGGNSMALRPGYSPMGPMQPMPQAGPIGPAPGQVGPGMGMPSPGGPPPMMLPSQMINGQVPQHAPPQMGPTTSPDQADKLTILSAIGAGPRPGNIAPTPGPSGGSFRQGSPPDVMLPSQMAGRRM